jgi:excisionase family DNA binding protein
MSEIRATPASDAPASTAGRSVRPPPDVMTVEELAAHLRVRPKTIYAAIRRKQIPGIVRVGRVIRISRSAVLAWLSGQDREVRSRRLP